MAMTGNDGPFGTVVRGSIREQEREKEAITSKTVLLDRAGN